MWRLSLNPHRAETQLDTRRVYRQINPNRTENLQGRAEKSRHTLPLQVHEHPTFHAVLDQVY